MRKVFHNQMSIGEVSIGDIEISIKSRDDVPRILLGLQYIYKDNGIRKELFELLDSVIPSHIDKNNGRPGMELWRVFVMSTLRVHLDWDYDRLEEMVNNHRVIRLMMGHGDYDATCYERKTLRNNLRLLTPEVLDKINQLIVKVGHKEVKKKEETLRGKCDSFVVETNVHFPTDINLLFDAIRKTIELTARLCDECNVEGWRQYKHNIRGVKKLYRKAQRSKTGRKKDKTSEGSRVKKTHKEYINEVSCFIQKAKNTIIELQNSDAKKNIFLDVEVSEIQKFIDHAERQIDQIARRVLNGEVIPHHEKTFSLFEPHTKWINKGKIGLLTELGLRVCIMSDQYKFILHHQVAEKEADAQLAVPMVKETKSRYKNLISVSFDRGFYSAYNAKKLEELLEEFALPKKGYRSQKDKEVEHSDQYKRSAYAHSRVESDINHLEQHGLDICLDHGIEGFKRYIAIATTSANLGTLGGIIKKKQIKKLKRASKILNSS